MSLNYKVGERQPEELAAYPRHHLYAKERHVPTVQVALLCDRFIEKRGSVSGQE